MPAKISLFVKNSFKSILHTSKTKQKNSGMCSIASNAAALFPSPRVAMCITASSATSWWYDFTYWNDSYTGQASLGSTTKE